jgi:hypothetical protein
MSLIQKIGNCINAVNWSDTEHIACKVYFGYLLGKYGVTEFENEINYYNGLGTMQGYSEAAVLRTLADLLGVTSPTLDNYTKTTLTNTPFLGTTHVPINWNYSGHDYFIVCRYGQIHMYKVAKQLNWELTKWNSSSAWQEMKNVFVAAGNKGVLGLDPRDNSYYAGEDRYYDEHTQSIACLIDLYEVDKVNNGGALTYARDTLWTYVNNTFWTGSYYKYKVANPDYECEAPFFYFVIGRMRALNGYSLTNWDRILTDIYSRFLINGWDSPQWTYGSTRYYSVVHTHSTNSQRRLGNTLMAWISLHAFYHLLDSTRQQVIRNLLKSDTGTAWNLMLAYSGLYDSSTNKFRFLSDGSVNDTATATGITLLFLLGIIPETGSLYIPLFNWGYECNGAVPYDLGGAVLNGYFKFDYANRKIRLPIKAGTLRFIYGTADVEYTFASDGIYEITFSTDWNSIVDVVKIGNLDPDLLYLTEPVSPPEIPSVNMNFVIIPTASANTVYEGVCNALITYTPPSGITIDHWRLKLNDSPIYGNVYVNRITGVFRQKDSTGNTIKTDSFNISRGFDATFTNESGTSYVEILIDKLEIFYSSDTTLTVDGIYDGTLNEIIRIATEDATNSETSVGSINAYKVLTSAKNYEIVEVSGTPPIRTFDITTTNTNSYIKEWWVEIKEVVGTPNPTDSLEIALLDASDNVLVSNSVGINVGNRVGVTHNTSARKVRVKLNTTVPNLRVSVLVTEAIDVSGA